MKKRKWAHVATYEITPLIGWREERQLWRLIQVDLFYAGNIVHKTIRDRNKNWSLAVGGNHLQSELVTSQRPPRYILRYEVNLWG